MRDVAFRVLGPVEAVDRAGGVAPLGRGRLTDLLAALIVSPGQIVSADMLIETVWHDRLPVHPRAALHSAVARLRRMTGGDFVQALGSGYRLHAEPDRVDLLRFERLRAAAGQQQETGAALAALTEAVELWRGAPLENVVSPVLLNDVVPRLTELYLQTCEEWAGLCLRAGQHDKVVSRLAGLAKAHPFRERMTGQLMVALYRAGRSADAIAAYEAMRRVLSDEMGIDPSPALQELHLKILRADPSLHDDLWQLISDPAGDTDPPPHGTRRCARRDRCELITDRRLRAATDLFAHTWDPVVVAVLRPGPKRRRELRAAIGGIGDEVLTQSLHRLTGRGLIIRRGDPEAPPRIEYALTRLGQSLADGPMQALKRWITDHGDELPDAREHAAKPQLSRPGPAWTC